MAVRSPVVTVAYDQNVELTATTQPHPGKDDRTLLAGPSIMFGAALAVFAVTIAVAYRPTLDPPVEALWAIVPWIVCAGLIVSLGPRSNDTGRWLGVLAALAGWVSLVAHDPSWSILAFVAFAMCYEVPAPQPTTGLTLAGVTTLAWSAAWWITEPGWIVAVPFAMFVGSAAIAGLLTRDRLMVDTQADLIRKLQQTQTELVASERKRGALEERARMAGEIHDTLAQGFTSIVLLSRSAQRSRPAIVELSEIEAEAQANLETARRLVAAAGPAELALVSLPAAIERAAATAFEGSAEWDLEVTGVPRPLAGDTEVIMLRGAQEAIANVTTHADATVISIVLSYRSNAIDLCVIDNGRGFVPGEIADRGSLTGGQGLRLLAERAAIMGGQLEVGGSGADGTRFGLTLPTGQP